MKIVILAGGTQSTIIDENEGLPKPMAEIGEKPILWHIMKGFSAQGYNDFIICGGYKVNCIKDYFIDYYIYQSDITVDLQTNKIHVHKKRTENWNVTVVDTGLLSTPGMRVLQIKDYVGEEDFIVIHGDCLSNINITELITTHKKEHKTATVTVAKPTGRNVILPIYLDGTMMSGNVAALPENQAWVNACCKVFTKDVFLYLEKTLDLGLGLFSRLSKSNQIVTYKHEGFWSPVETKRDYVSLQKLWNESKAPWKIW